LQSCINNTLCLNYGKNSNVICSLMQPVILPVRGLPGLLIQHRNRPRLQARGQGTRTHIQYIPGSVADPGSRVILTPGSGSGTSFWCFRDLGSRISYFSELGSNFLGKFYLNFLPIGKNFFSVPDLNKIIFFLGKLWLQNYKNCFPLPLFCCY
jgi:hypothetical protein